MTWRASLEAMAGELPAERRETLYTGREAYRHLEALAMGELVRSRWS